MSRSEIKSLPSAAPVSVSSKDVSIGDTLRRVKTEQRFLGEPLYGQIASSLVAIPSESTARKPDQVQAYSAVVSFIRKAEAFRFALAEPRAGISEAKLETERELATSSLKRDIQTGTSHITKVVYCYEATTDVASTLAVLYSSHQGKYLERVQPKTLGQSNKTA